MSILISEEYRTLCEDLHKTDKRWGNGPSLHLFRALQFVEGLKVRDIIDYGCGKGGLSRVDQKRRYKNYDPAIPKFSNRPEPAEALVAIDVLEHVEPELMDGVLEDIATLTNGRCLLIISTQDAKESLADGRNAHISKHPYEWWVPKLAINFRVKVMEVDPAWVTFECIPLRLYKNTTP